MRIETERLILRTWEERDRARDFEHPKVPQGHWLRPHVRYAIGRPG